MCLPGQRRNYAGAGQVVKAASGLATLSGTNPTGYEIFNAIFAWEQCKERKEVCCKCGLPRYCLTDLKNRDLRRRNETQSKCIFSQIWLNLEGSCFLNLKKNASPN